MGIISLHLLCGFQIPFINTAQKLTKNNIKLFASLWSAPKWIKDSGKFRGGVIKDQFYQVYANYFVKFLDDYKKEGVTYWGITTGNEPSIHDERYGIPSVGWTPETLVSILTVLHTHYSLSLSLCPVFFSATFQCVLLDIGLLLSFRFKPILLYWKPPSSHFQHFFSFIYVIYLSQYLLFSIHINILLIIFYSSNILIKKTNFDFSNKRFITLYYVSYFNWKDSATLNNTPVLDERECREQ